MLTGLVIRVVGGFLVGYIIGNLYDMWREKKS